VVFQREPEAQQEFAPPNRSGMEGIGRLQPVVATVGGGISGSMVA